MDGPSTNWKFFEELSSQRKESQLRSLIDIGSCGLHIIHGAFKAGAEATLWGLKETVKGAYNLFHDSPARREDYTSRTGSNVFPLSFCGTRWVEDQQVADRLIEQWDNIVAMVRFWEKLPNLKQPSSKSFLSIQKAVSDCLIVTKLQFFSFVAGCLYPFLTQYQTDAPMVPFMYSDLKNLIVSLLPLFVKSDVIENCKLSSDLKKLDLGKKEILLSVKSVSLGFAAEVSLAKLKKHDQVSFVEVDIFRKDCVLVKKIFERTPLESSLARCCTCILPNEMATRKTSMLLSKMKCLLHTLVGLHIKTTNESDIALKEFAQFLSTEMKLNLEKFSRFDRKLQRLDDFFFHEVNAAKFPELSSLIKAVFSLSHGQTSVERGFSINKSVLAENILSDTIVARRLIKDHMLANKLHPHDIHLSQKLLLAVKGARLRYETYSEARKSEQSKNVADQQVAIIEKEIAEVKSKKELLRTCSSLEKDLVSYAKQAEEKQDFSLLSKANAMKRRSEETMKDMEKLETTLDLSLEKRKKINT